MHKNKLSADLIKYYPELEKILELREVLFMYCKDPELFKLLINKMEEMRKQEDLDLTVEELYFLVFHLNFLDKSPTTKYNKDAYFNPSPDLY